MRCSAVLVLRTRAHGRTLDCPTGSNPGAAYVGLSNDVNRTTGTGTTSGHCTACAVGASRRLQRNVPRSCTPERCGLDNVAASIGLGVMRTGDESVLSDAFRPRLFNKHFFTSGIAVGRVHSPANGSVDFTCPIFCTPSRPTRNMDIAVCGVAHCICGSFLVPGWCRKNLESSRTRHIDI